MMAAAEMSSLMRTVGRCNEKDKEVGGEARRSDIITMDLLGGCGGAVGGSRELDLDLQVPLGWEKRLDLSSGEVYFERSINSTSNRDNRRREGQNPVPLPISTSLPPPNLDLNLFFPSPFSTSKSPEYQSVCTLDKIKFALDRIKKPHFSNGNPNSSSSPTSMSGTTSSIKEKRHILDRIGNSRSSVLIVDESGGQERLLATGCPGCLSYVLLDKGNPRCPRCNSDVPLPATKKRRVELNLFNTTTNTSSTAVPEIS